MGQRVVDSQLRQHIAARVAYYRELGIYDFYRREGGPKRAVPQSTVRENAQNTEAAASSGRMGEKLSAEVASTSSVKNRAESNAGVQTVRDPVAELKAIREDIGECTRCILHKGRTQIVFGVGNPKAELMFIGEAPGADEDQQGLPFVGRAGQLLTNMIGAMGLTREDIYIANIIKCRPPGNRTPEREECETCSPFLMRQIAAIRPKAIVALGAVAAKTLLAINAPMAELRGRWYDFVPQVAKTFRSGAEVPPIKLAVTYHPAYLLRDPRQKKETWKDLQMVMKFMGLNPLAKPPNPA